MKLITLEVFGMKCEGCVNTVKSTLEDFKGIHNVEVNLIPPEAVISYDDKYMPEDFIKHLHNKTHYKALVKVNK